MISESNPFLSSTLWSCCRDFCPYVDLPRKERRRRPRTRRRHPLFCQTTRKTRTVLRRARIYPRARNQLFEPSKQSNKICTNPYVSFHLLFPIHIPHSLPCMPSISPSPSHLIYMALTPSSYPFPMSKQYDLTSHQKTITSAPNTTPSSATCPPQSPSHASPSINHTPTRSTSGSATPTRQPLCTKTTTRTSTCRSGAPSHSSYSLRSRLRLWMSGVWRR